MIGFTNAGGGGSSGIGYAVIHAEYPEGSTCTCSNGTKTLRAKATTGVWNFGVPSAGEWTVSCSNADTGESASKVVTISAENEAVSVKLAYRVIPDFMYTGTYELVNDSDVALSESELSTTENWKIRFLDSGTLTITDMYGFDGSVDVFLVGGGGNGGSESGAGRGAGGGGGYTLTAREHQIGSDTQYEIVIGGSGSESTAFGYTAAGGSNGSNYSTNKGGDGGSGGGQYDHDNSGGDGGSDGSDGGGTNGGAGQGTTTREFGEATGTLYAGGGGGGTYNYNVRTVAGGSGGEGGGGNGGSSNVPTGGTTDAPTAGQTNTGGGGGGGKSGALGGSGIVIIRNAR